MNKRLTRGIGWLTALMMCCLMLVGTPTSAWAVEDSSLSKVYVSKGGDDETGDGSAGKPVATLARAVALAAPGTADNPTEIYVMSDLTMTASARYWNKHIAISSQGESAPFTVTRGKYEGGAGDPARQEYNAAMIEVNGHTDGGIVSTLSLTNIIFDDNGVHAGKYFIQASSRGTGTTDFGDLSGEKAIDNSDIVQDSMIAVYKTESGASRLVTVLYSRTTAACLLFVSPVASLSWKTEVKSRMTQLPTGLKARKFPEQRWTIQLRTCMGQRVRSGFRAGSSSWSRGLPLRV